MDKCEAGWLEEQLEAEAEIEKLKAENERLKAAIEMGIMTAWGHGDSAWEGILERSGLSLAETDLPDYVGEIEGYRDAGR
jgi:hypothetical protein